MKTSAEVLEFEPLRQLVGRYISSAMGRRELDKLLPHNDRDRLVSDLAETVEAEGSRVGACPSDDQTRLLAACDLIYPIMIYVSVHLKE